MLNLTSKKYLQVDILC